MNTPPPRELLAPFSPKPVINIMSVCVFVWVSDVGSDKENFKQRAEISYSPMFIDAPIVRRKG